MKIGSIIRGVIQRSAMRVFLSLLLLLSLSFRGISQVTGVIAPASLYVNAHGGNNVVGLRPAQVRHAYGFDQIENHGEGQTIGIIIPFDNPNIQNDLAIFSQEFGLPCCDFEKLFYPRDTVPVFPSSSPSSLLELFQLESSLDVEWAHAIAPRARIVLVETTFDIEHLTLANQVAVDAGASVISISWAANENTFSTKEVQMSFDERFEKPNVAFVAAAGDTGNYSCHGVASLCWPAVASVVTAVGGTTLHIDSKANYIGEVALKASGGGLSINEDVPDYQIPFNPYAKRGVPDVAYHANPQNGFAVYDSNPFLSSTGWQEIGGTSAGAPQWAALIAIANSMRQVAGKGTLSGSNPHLYSIATGPGYASNYHDITAGTNTNGHCGPLCSAARGYDFVTGLGSPKAANLINALASLP